MGEVYSMHMLTMLPFVEGLAHTFPEAVVASAEAPNLQLSSLET